MATSAAPPADPTFPTPETSTRPPLALARLATLTPPFPTRAWHLAPHPTLPLLAACGADTTVRLYSLAALAQVSSIGGGHRRSVRASAWQPVGTGARARACVLATGSFDASVGVWRREGADDAGAHGDDEDDGDDEGDAGKAAWWTGLTGDAHRGDAADEDEEEEEWRFALVLDGHTSEVKAVAWAAGGHLLATGGRDKSVWVWEVVGDDDYETVAVLQEHAGDVKGVAWHPTEELLASCSYDDDVRLWREDVDDWSCGAVLAGHEATVWALAWEPQDVPRAAALRDGGKGKGKGKGREAWWARREDSGPRLASCSADGTIRVWRRARRAAEGVRNELSRFRSSTIEEEWVQEAVLPQQHERCVYAIAWSQRTGRMASVGDDGRIVVYEERWKQPPEATGQAGDAPEADRMELDGDADAAHEASEWVAIAERDGAHGDFEVNHVVWARRADRGKRGEDEEVLATAGDDGNVNVWTLNE